MALLHGSWEQPCWLGADPPFPAEDALACQNAIVHLPSVGSSDCCMVPPTPAFFAGNALGYDFATDAPLPSNWLTFLGEQWADDPQAIQALQEFFGYCLLPDTSQQKILVIVGPRRSGKGTIARVLRGLVGQANTAAPTLAGLATNFGLQSLLGKTVAIISDARLSGRTDTAVLVERLLSISGEDAQTVDRKNLPAITTRLPVRFVILTNELPRLTDASAAIVGRFLVLRQTRSWFGKEDPALTHRLLGELPSILLWAIEGRRRLCERGHFVQPASSILLVKEMEDLASPLRAFLGECCEVGPACEVAIAELYGAWTKWCERSGRKDVGSQHVFGRDLRAALPALDVRQPRVGGARVRTYAGVRLRPDL